MTKLYNKVIITLEELKIFISSLFDCLDLSYNEINNIFSKIDPIQKYGTT